MSGLFGPRYNPTKLKLNLKLAITRLGMLQKKNENAGVLARKEVARLLEKGKDELARIKVEQIIRDDFYMETMELMEMYLNLLIARFGLIETVKHCDPGIQEAVSTVIWATPRMQGDVQEMKIIKQLLQARYGREFIEEALENRGGTVNTRVIHKLSVIQPETQLIDGYLMTIAEKYGVQWTPTVNDVAAMPSKVDELIDLGPAVAAGVPKATLEPAPMYNPAMAFPPPPAATATAAMPPPPPHAAVAAPAAAAAAAPAAATTGPTSIHLNPAYRAPPQSNPYDMLPEPPSAAGGASAMAATTTLPPQMYPPAPVASSSSIDPFPAGTGDATAAAGAEPHSLALAGLDALPDLPAFVPGNASVGGGGGGVGGASAGSAAGAGSTVSSSSELPDFDELTRRFNQLKGK